MDRKDFLSDLAQEVILPVVDILHHKLEKKYSTKEIVHLLEKRLKISHLILSFLNKNVDTKKILQQFQELEEIKRYGLNDIDIMLILSYLNCRFRKFVKKHNLEAIEDGEICELLEELFMKDDVINNQNSDISNDFVDDIDESEIRDELENMHYKDEEKITAKEFMEDGAIDEDIIVDIKDLLEDYEDMSYKYNVASDEFLQTTLEVLQKFVTLFMLSGEFKDLGRVTETLFDKLKNLDLDSLDDNQKQFLKSFLDAFMADLKKWYEEIIIYKSANDIHYLDASLMSSIEQISFSIK